MAIRVQDHGVTYGVTVGESEIKGLCLVMPASGLNRLRGLKVQFDKKDGHRVGLWIKGTCDPARVDPAALVALVDGMQCYAEAQLGLETGACDPGRTDWRGYFRAPKKGRAPPSSPWCPLDRC